MRGSKPGERRGGRKKGTPNKFTSLAREGIEKAAKAIGGPKRLAAWAKEDPQNEKAFWSAIYTKLLPVQVTDANDGPIKTEDVTYSDKDRAMAIAALLAKAKASQ